LLPAHLCRTLSDGAKTLLHIEDQCFAAGTIVLAIVCVCVCVCVYEWKEDRILKWAKMAMMILGCMTGVCSPAVTLARFHLHCQI
jgi:hypothetical protein